jgi:hypothetical protein
VRARHGAADQRMPMPFATKTQGAARAQALDGRIIGLHAVRGQYTAGTAYGSACRATATAGVDPSRTETFVALRTEIASWHGPACPSTCAPASGSPRARRKSS